MCTVNEIRLLSRNPKFFHIYPYSMFFSYSIALPGMLFFLWNASLKFMSLVHLMLNL